MNQNLKSKIKLELFEFNSEYLEYKKKCEYTLLKRIKEKWKYSKSFVLKWTLKSSY